MEITLSTVQELNERTTDSFDTSNRTLNLAFDFAHVLVLEKLFTSRNRTNIMTASNDSYYETIIMNLSDCKWKVTRIKVIKKYRICGSNYSTFNFCQISIIFLENHNCFVVFYGFVNSNVFFSTL